MGEQEKVSRSVQFIAEQSIDKASQSLSKLLKAGAQITLKKVDLVDIAIVTEDVNRENQEVIGAFVDLVGDAPFKFLFYVSMEGAYLMTDLMLRRQEGTTQEYNVYVSGAIQEIGNILSSAFANTFAAHFKISMKPTPPVVINDFSGTLFQELIMDAAMEENKILLMDSSFEVVKVKMQCRVFVLPQPGSYRMLAYAGGEE